jgi:rhodanese-related sulfurtransferase
MKRWFTATAIGFLTLSAHAIEFGISAKETYEKVDIQDPNVLFVDVRDPVEIMFVGFTDLVHVNVPFLLVDRTKWEEKRGVYQLDQNAEFVAQIKAALEKRGLNKNAEIITLCRSGSERGEPSAKLLRDAGFPNARFVINGFQGSPVKSGPQTGFRILNGWQNSGLPWSMQMTPSKMYRTDRQ